MDLYHYSLPPDRIAQKPASPRDSSQLLIYNTQTDEVKWDTFLHVDRYLPSKSLLVMNETKVLPCRVHAEGAKGPVELLVMSNEWKPTDTVLLASANKKLHPGEIVELPHGHTLTVLESNEKVFKFSSSFNLKKLPEVLARIGEMPVPRYIEDCPLTEKEKRHKYQTIFAHQPGSVAAPTASLHFTPRVFKKLQNAGIQKTFLTLHVGLGTFAPVLPEHLATKTLYKEWYQIPSSTLEKIHTQKNTAQPIIAVGTTATRSLESFARSGALTGTTDLFIMPPYPFQILDGLMTNFHVPGSSLMMLVEAFLQHKKAKRHLVDLYSLALQHDFRFYSFGDAMLIL
jgi:S-adenosylmethionine:tRNA ribosyltransferase-isomerase